MNAPTPPLTLAEQQALSAPFLVEAQEVVRKIARLADERGTPMVEIVQLAAEDNLQRHERGRQVPDWLQRFWDERPLPLPTGLKADKRFFDAPSGDL